MDEKDGKTENQSLNKTNKVRARQGLIIAAIIVSFLGITFAVWHLYVSRYAANTIKENIENTEDIEGPDEFEDAFREAAEEMKKTEKEMKTADEVEDTADAE